MEIVNKLREIRDKIQFDWDGEGETIANQMRALSIAAMKEGMKVSDEGLKENPDLEKLTAWEKYTRLISTDHDEFLRLTSRDAEFNKLPWADQILTYVLGNGECTDTSFADTTRYLERKHLKNLDETIPTA